MIKRTIKYTDFLGNDREEEFLFNMNKAEITKWLTTSGDYTIDRLFLKLRNERNGERVIELFESLLRMAYGKISLDGRKFEKSDEIWNDFYQSNAYSILFMELISDGKKAAEFINGMFPEDIEEEIKRIMNENPNELIG